MRKGRNKQRGSSLIEFTFVGIPLIFVLISTFEISRGMWIYETLGYAIKDAARYAIVHGQGCATNNCQIHVSDIANRIAYVGVGLDPSLLTVTIRSSSRTISCSPLANCKNDNSCFPTAADCSGTLDWSAVAGMPITVTATYPFKSSIAMFTPGGSSIIFGTYDLPASARERIAF